MFGQLYSHDEFTKYIAIFGSLFNNIIISRDADDGTQVQKIKVPIQYGPREKALARTDSDPQLNRPYAELLPRMSFEMVNFEYDGSRKRASSQRWAVKKTNGNQKISFDAMYMPVPYNIDFELSITANRAKDACRIVQSILPNFRPDLTITAAIVDELPDYLIDIPITRTGISMEDTYDEGNYENRRLIVWKLSFQMKAEIYGPVTEAKIIKVAKVNLYADKPDGSFDTTPDETIQIRPGLTANGQPTSNAALSIPYGQISEDDNWGYIIEITDNTINDA